VTDGIVDDIARHRLLISGEGGAEAELVYERDGDRLFLVHTEVPPAFRGMGTGGKLVTAALELARRDGLVVVPWCPYARRWLQEHTDATNGVEIDWATLPPHA